MTWERGKKQRPELATERWKQLSLYIRRHEPLCRVCTKAGRVTLATETDHIDESHPDPFDVSNLQPICGECNRLKEMGRRGYKRRPRIGTDGWPTDEA